MRNKGYAGQSNFRNTYSTSPGQKNIRGRAYPYFTRRGEERSREERRGEARRGEEGRRKERSREGSTERDERERERERGRGGKKCRTSKLRNLYNRKRAGTGPETGPGTGPGTGPEQGPEQDRKG